MLGDRDYRQLIKNAIDSIGREIQPKIDPNDIKTIHLHEVVQCLRRSYFDRVEPKEVDRRGFTDLVSGLLRNMKYGSKSGELKMKDIGIKGQADMIVDDAVIIFRSANRLPENPIARDLLYLNTCLWIFDKMDGILIYITSERQETSFTLSRNKKMFVELSIRIRIFNNLLKEKKVPILEPSDECSNCQYYEKCYLPQKTSESISLSQLVGFNK